MVHGRVRYLCGVASDRGVPYCGAARVDFARTQLTRRVMC